MTNDGSQAELYRDDEIDLFELVEGLWARKWLIMGITGAATVAGLITALLLSPSYQASTQVRPPDLSDLAQLSELEIVEITPTEAFARGLNELNSQHGRMRTFDAVRDSSPQDLGDEEWNWRTLSEHINITPDKGNNFATVSYTNGDAEFSAAVVNQLIETANQLATQTLVEEVKTSLQTKASLLQQRIEQEIALEARSKQDRITQLQERDKLKALILKDQIAALRTKEEQLRLDRIAQLTEALSVAQSLGLEEPQFIAQLGAGTGNSLAIRADIEGEGDPLYLRGARMLKAEIAALKQRSSNDFTNPDIRNLESDLAMLEYNREVEVLQARADDTAFIVGIRDMRTELNQLKSYLKQDFSGVRVLKLDEPAVAPDRPIKPRKSLIVAASLVAGGMLGVLVALIMNAAANRRRALGGQG
ncbi:hypothetical protein FV139_17880 [Parahaliea maris]|uniref:Chain-length determining protein n=1 Tax=Parahaliea maris TaxID=2716870 RepID=A0A5C8ZT29_9GAMM|nr:Wzz/FepE/Etk N-terminal domain-containing protein [Parahaliea maris]TXS90840.1 hypothetical protein FV139_17880 [Parahaliea maris]